jgi:hypothetical protein
MSFKSPKIQQVRKAGASPLSRETTESFLTRNLSHIKMDGSDAKIASAVRQSRSTCPDGSILSKNESSNLGVSACTSYRKRPASFSTTEVKCEEMNDIYANGNLPTKKPRRPVLNRNDKSKANSSETGVRPGTNYNSGLCESESPRSARSASAQENLSSHRHLSCKTIVHLKPLDIGFAIKNAEPISFDSEVLEFLGEKLDEWCPHFQRISIDGFKYSLNIFKFEGRYYSEEILKLWQLQAMERFTNNTRISGSVMETPANMSLYRLGFSLTWLGTARKLNGEIWRSLEILKNLPTKRKRTLSLCDICYTAKRIEDTLNGKSIIKTLVEVFTDEIRDHELCVMEFENKYYTLENKKLWVLRHAEKVLGKLNIIGNVKISMDHLLFYSFTAKDITNVDMNLTRDIHTNEERFMLQYIQRLDKEVL